MNQAPIYPNYPMSYNYQPPQVNAVKIDIINPQAIGGAQSPMTAPQPQQAPQQPEYYYNYPQASAYGMPTNSYYNVPQAPAMSYPQAPQMPPMPMAPQPQPQQQVPVQEQTVAYPQPQQQPVQQAPTAAVPPPFVEQQPAAPPAPPVAQAPAAQPTPVAAPAVEPAPAPKAQSGIDPTVINSALKSENLEAQTEAIQKIAEVGQTNPQDASSLLNEETFRALTDIITKDNSKLPGPTPKQIELRKKEESGKALTPEEKTEADALSPQEKAEMNKQFGTYTLAVLQKNFRDAVDAETKAQNQPPITIGELPGVVDIVNNIKDNKNPVIREAGISALSYLARPEDKQLLSTVFDITAKQDADPVVKEAAKQAKAKLQG